MCDFGSESARYDIARLGYNTVYNHFVSVANAQTLAAEFKKRGVPYSINFSDLYPYMIQVWANTQYSGYDPTFPTYTVNQLNEELIDYVLPIIQINVDAYNGYKKVQNTFNPPPQPYGASCKRKQNYYNNRFPGDERFDF